MNSSRCNKYKTESCWHFSVNGFCSRGDRCHFLHGPNDPLRPSRPLRHKVENYKTAPCANLFVHGFCKFGIKCLFHHGILETWPGSQAGSLVPWPLVVEDVDVDVDEDKDEDVDVVDVTTRTLSMACALKCLD